MSHYSEYLHGSMDEDEFRHACRMEFAGDDEDLSDCAGCPYYKLTRVNMFTIRKQCEYDYCIREEEQEEENV